MMNNIYSILISLAFFSLGACNKSSPNEQINKDSTQSVVTEQLAKGINLSNWFNDFSDKNQFTTRFNNNHFNQIKSAGFTYIRLPIGPSVLVGNNNIADIQPANLALVDKAVQQIINAGLAVVIEMHAFGPNFEARLAIDPLARASFRQFWKSLATHFKQYDSSKLFFEIWNEPHIGATELVAGIDKNWWAPFQEQIIQSIREATPNHFIIATAENFSNWFDLIQLTPSTQKNIIYTFHLYDPFTFTHQSADWLGSPYAGIRFLPYPGTTQNVATLAANAISTAVKNQIEFYGRQSFGIDSLNKIIQQVYNWSMQKKVTVICNEFGVHKKFAPPDSRLRFLSDAKNMLEKYKIPWAVWDYDDTFGLASYPSAIRNGNPIWDDGVLNALGLK